MKTTTEIAIDLNMPVHVVQRVLMNWREIGDVCKDRAHMGRAPLMKQDSIKLMLGLLERCPDMYLDEIQEQLEEQNNVIVSLATIYRSLRRLGITSKKLSRAAQERCEEACRNFTLEIGGEPPERLVTADEAAVNILKSYCENGWAP
ncbi:uncharacterized protein LACBIDRAFT_308513 [Laccaria bicolor S238N-H82]|uniref:Predicted protein n=1 Tax=Laccaria bicolor (strain S238N-H82 / ATCC MYA-4686) TaxID=486041 RepID=B0CWI7_LACBS|nr:uncharacterized protein LACBIDRAFT_308513 [Laccaria bicolor S238N-H82]EDR13075.1 predicted protein [Laccaria bicolor S238N-H82]|eukprot:XP_001875573.1 predicted protein [Laccaria bicolor S238N-H82]